MSSDTTLNEEERALRSLSPAEGFFTPLQTPNTAIAQQELGSQNVAAQDQTPKPKKKKPKKKKKKSSVTAASVASPGPVAPLDPAASTPEQPPAILPNGIPGLPTPSTPSLSTKGMYSSYMDDYRQKVKDPDHYYAKADQRMAAKAAKEAAEKAAGIYEPLEKVTDVASYYRMVDRLEAEYSLEDDIDSEMDISELRSPLDVSQLHSPWFHMLS